MTEQEEFDSWKARVDLHLVSMVKKSSNEINVPYDLTSDFQNNIPPKVTAIRIIERVYKPQM